MSTRPSLNVGLSFGEQVRDPARAFNSNTGLAPSGHLVFSRSPTNRGIWAVPFSLSSGTVTGEPFLAIPNGAFPSVGPNGTLRGTHQMVASNGSVHEMGTLEMRRP